MLRHALTVGALALGGCAANEYTRWTPDCPEDVLEAAVPGLRNDGMEPSLAFADRVRSGRSYSVFDRMKIRAGDRRAPAPDAGSDEARGPDVAARNAMKLAISYGDELAAIHDAGRDRRIGLALSGGGVRSASYAQGVLMGLQAMDVLPKVGYLSTVSGGGYTGAWYMTHRRDDDALLREGSIHLRHLAKSGKILDMNGNDTEVGVVSEIFSTSLLWLPCHVMANDVLDLDIRMFGPRVRYRHGLARAFLYQTPDDKDSGHPTCLSLATSSPRSRVKDDETRPSWIVNCHLALGNDYRFRNRTGDAFEITPFRAGADAVGYVRTDNSQETLDTTADDFWMRTDYAIAASGAAVDTADTRGGGLVEEFRGVLNVNMGYSIDGWTPGWPRGEGGQWWRAARKALAWVPFACHLSSQDGRTTDSVKYYVTDGGHFENTGAYALVRRGCRLIIVSDAGWDEHLPDWSRGDPNVRACALEDYRNLEERIYADFGARLCSRWDGFCGCEDAAAPPAGSDDAPPKGDGRVLVATIDNLPVEGMRQRVVLLIVRMTQPPLTRLRQEFGTIDREKARDPQFGNDETTDQFFSESRVLAYRQLALETVEKNRAVIEWAMRGLESDPAVTDVSVPDGGRRTR